jgi:ribose transport system permease protein
MMKQKEFFAKVKSPDFRYRYLHVVMIYLFLIVLISVASIINSDFTKVNNLRNILISSFPLMLAAFGQTFVILTGGIDLSIGGIIALSNVTCVTIMTSNEGVGGMVLAILAALAVGILSGALNGIFITKGRLPAIIVTIATTAIFSGIALFILPIPGGSVFAPFGKFLNGNLAGFPYVIVFLIVFTIILRMVTNKTTFGVSIRAVGGNESAAYSTGITVWKAKLLTYVVCGLLSAMAGIFLAAQMYSGDPTIGRSFSMNSITAAVVGGTVMTGAVGDLLGTITGVLIIYIINNMLNLIGVSSFYQSIFQGLILIIALVISRLKAK